MQRNRNLHLLQSGINVARDAVLINSIIGSEVLIESTTVVVHSHLTSAIHISSGCMISGLNDSDVSVSDPVFKFKEKR